MTIYEGMAARGVPQKVSKTEIKIVRAMAKIKGWIEDLAAEDRKMVMKLAKAQNDKRQLMLFDELPTAAKPKKPKAEKKPENVVQLIATPPSGAA